MNRLLILTWIFLSGCVSIPEIATKETRFVTKVYLSEFNDVASQYIPKPTFATLISYPNGEGPDSLSYIADAYGSSYNQYIGVTKNKIGFHVQHTKALEFVSSINKFLEWSKTATQNGDAFTKDIADIYYDAESVGGISVYYKLTFHSGNQEQHYLLVKSCSYSRMTNEICYGNTALTPESSLELKSEINKFLAGEIVQRDIASKYN